MSDISGGDAGGSEVSDVSTSETGSTEVTGDGGHSTDVSESSFSETGESEMDEELSDMLEETYNSYLDGKGKPLNYDVSEGEKNSVEKSDNEKDLKAELDDNYQQYLNENGKTFEYSKSRNRNDILETDYSRPTHWRTGMRDEVWDSAKDEHGRVRDPVTGRYMSKEQPWHMGHKPGYEFHKHQNSAKEREISREEFLDEYYKTEHYRPELPKSNYSHKGENVTDEYFGD